MHTVKFLKDKKKFTSYFHITKKNNIYFNMHFGFNNKFIRAMRTRLIFQKYPKMFCFVFF